MPTTHPDRDRTDRYAQFLRQEETTGSGALT